MYWRGDPHTGKSAPTNDNWPRNGSVLKGEGPYLVRGENWLKVAEIKQAGSDSFKKVPEGTWMMYTQNGPLLRSMK